MNTVNLVSLQNVYKTYGHVTALKNISFDIQEGSFISIFGANGAGKSTLLKILSNQTRPSKGEIYYSSISAKKLQDSYRKKFGVISHQPFLYENLSALENLTFYGNLYGIKNAEKRAEELLKKVDLYNRRHDAIRTFSRGMLQRVSIVRALIHNPEMIFLDEPYTGLDSVASASLTAILKEQLEGNKTILMVTHDLKIGLELSSKVIIMKKGEIVYSEDRCNIDETSFEKLYISYAGKNEVVV